MRIPQSIDELRGDLGVFLNGLQLNIDVINACSLRCWTCAIGSMGYSRGGAQMSFDLFRKILDKAESEVGVRKVQLYHYSDPCLHKDLHLFVKDLTDRGIYSAISTMAQRTNCDMEKVIEARPTEFRLSFPGWEKMPYYQKGASVERFNREIDRICSLPRHPETTWTMAFHLYNDNQHEWPRVKKLAERYGLKLVAIPAIFMPLSKTVRKDYTEQDLEIISHLIETPEESMSRMKYPTNYCKLWKQISLDAEGYVYLCQLVYEDEFKMMKFMDVHTKKITEAIKTHSFCGSCMKIGAHAYQYCFDDFVTSKDPIGDADKHRRVAKENAVWKGVVKG